MITRHINKAMETGDWEKAMFSVAEFRGLPKQVRRVREGLEIIEEGGVTDKSGKMLAPVKETMEIVRSFLKGRYGSLASQDWIRNIGKKTDDREWFVPQVEFLQNGDYERKAELFNQFTEQEQKELRDMLSEGQQKKLDKELSKTPVKSKKKNLSEIFGSNETVPQKSLEEIFQ